MEAKTEDEEFLAQQPSWVSKILQGDYDLNAVEREEMIRADWPNIVGDAKDQYLEILRRNPKKLREYRELQKKLAAESALRNLPSLRPGPHRLDAIASEAKQLEQAGFTQAEIALSLSRKYPDRKDRKGNTKLFTAEGVRKLLKRRGFKTPDKM
jgi:hypothetical protein